jgi:hypothetical protein
MGRHASVMATAAAVAARAVCEGALPLASPPIPLPNRRVVLFQLGRRNTAIEVFA